ncbi:MAG: hypothetical protein GF398_03940 [Chitinivibrionales bacterium]|nr:hypothetical protein [Chitinivibrionales bacterium]
MIRVASNFVPANYRSASHAHIRASIEYFLCSLLRRTEERSYYEKTPNPVTALPKISPWAKGWPEQVFTGYWGENDPVRKLEVTDTPQTKRPESSFLAVWDHYLSPLRNAEIK